MIGALLLTAVSIPQVPVDLDVPLGLERSTIELAVQATATHFVARSYSQTPVVLFLGTPGTALSTTLRLAPGAEVRYTFCRGCIEDVFVEVLSMRAGGWSNTGSLPLAQLSASTGGALWIQSAEERSIGWLAEQEALEIAHPEPSMLPSSLLLLHAELDDFSEPTQPMHVPVITPEADKDGSKPPVIEPTPLPPV